MDGHAARAWLLWVVNMGIRMAAMCELVMDIVEALVAQLISHHLKYTGGHR